MKTHKFARKPFYVDAVRVNEANIEEVAKWCEGTIKNEDGRKYIEVTVYRPMTDRQTMAFVGDWVLYAGSGFKVYNSGAFDKAFEKVKTLTKEQADAAGIKVPHEKRPPKKKPIPRAPSNPVLSPKDAEELKRGKAPEAEIKASTDTKVEWDIDANRPMEETRRLEAAEEINVDPETIISQAEADALIESVLRTPQAGDHI